MDNFNWVRERQKCSLRAVFAQLKLDIEQDVKERNALRPENATFEFHFVHSDKTCAVVLESELGDASVQVGRDGDFIIVKNGEGKEMLRASLTLNDKGECVFVVGGEQRTSWHLRKMALEDLFFKGIR